MVGRAELKSLCDAGPRVPLMGRIRRLLGLAPAEPDGRRLRADGRFEDCWGDCGDDGMYCCDGMWDDVRKAQSAS